MIRSYLFFFILLFTFSGSVVAQSPADNYRELYEAGKYKEAEAAARKAARSKSGSGEDWYFLGLAEVQNEKYRSATGSFGRAIALAPEEPRYWLGSAHARFYRGDPKAIDDASTVLKLNANSPAAHFILGSAKLQSGDAQKAYDHASAGISLNGNHAASYLLRGRATILQATEVRGPDAGERRRSLLRGGVADFDKFLALSGTAVAASKVRSELESLKNFVEHYKGVNDPIPDKNADPEAAASDYVPMKLGTRPPAVYTRVARQEGLQGVVVILAMFDRNGSVSDALVIKPLGLGLDDQARTAARRIRFTPASRNGERITVVRLIEYHFTLF